jgi:AraC family transcriptional regulator of arabinose operon
MVRSNEHRHAPVAQLLTGHFNETSGYRAYRRDGVGDWLMVHTRAGQGRFGHAGGDLLAGPGEWVLIRPGTLHDYAVAPQAERWELLWAHFQPRPEWLAWLKWPEVARGLMHLAPPPGALDARFLEVHRLFTSDLLRREAFAMNALEALLLECDRHNPLTVAPVYDARVLRAMEYVEGNLGRKIGLPEVAQAAGISVSRLSHVFREQTGETLQRHLEAVRMRRAAELLQRTGFSIQQVAGAVGFDSPFYFSLRFKRWSGASPAAFRDKSVATGR